MHEQPRTTPYEVLCHHCNVTFPVGSKRCIHCGGRLGRRTESRRLSLEMATPFQTTESFQEEETAEEAEPQKRSSFMPAALLWALLFAGMSIHRACSSG